MVWWLSLWVGWMGWGDVAWLGIPPNDGCVQQRRACDPVGKAEIALWYGDAVAATSLTFDDSLPSQYKHLVPLLGEFGFLGTFFLNTVDLEKAEPNIWRQSLGCWPHWRKVRALGHELGSHTVNHPNLSQIPPRQVEHELRDSCGIIRRRVPQARCHTLAYPYGVSNPRVRKRVRAYYIAARGAMHKIAPHSPKDMMNVPSVTPFQKTTRTQMLQWIKQGLRQRGWVVWMFHGTRKQGWEALPLRTYRFLFEALKKQGKRYWIAPFGEVARYVYLRRETMLKVSNIREDRMTLQIVRKQKTQIPLRGALLQSARQHRLTAKLWIPLAWKAITVSQGSTSQTIQSFRSGRCQCAKEAIFSFDPHTEIIEIQAIKHKK